MTATNKQTKTIVDYRLIAEHCEIPLICTHPNIEKIIHTDNEEITIDTIKYHEEVSVPIKPLSIIFLEDGILKICDAETFTDNYEITGYDSEVINSIINNKE